MITCDRNTSEQAEYRVYGPGNAVLDFCAHHRMQHMGTYVPQGWFALPLDSRKASELAARMGVVREAEWALRNALDMISQEEEEEEQPAKKDQPPGERT